MNKNWTYVPFTDVFAWCQKSNIGSREAIENGKYKLFVASATEIKRYDTFLEDGERLVFGTGGNPCIHYVNEAFSYTNHTECAKPICEDAFVKFYYYYFQKDKYNALQSTFVGGGIKNSSKKKIGALLVPQIDYTEQKRIVSRIEELFSELDNGVETLKKTKQQIAVYRQAVLKSVLDGYKTDIKMVRIGDVCQDVKVGIVIKPTQYYVPCGGVRAFRNANVRRNYIEDTDWAMISQEGHKKNIHSEVHTGDVLIARSGVNLGMAAAVSEKFDGYNAIDVVIAVPKCDVILPQYLAYYTNSPYGINSVKRNQRGVAQGHLNINVYGKLPLMLPKIEIQKKIISEIEARISICDSIEKTVDTALQQAEAMRQSILKKAFEGEL